MSKILKITIVILAAVLLIYLSLDIQNLEKHRTATQPAGFNSINYATEFWNNSLPLCIAKATELNGLLEILNKNPMSAFEKYGHKLGISKTHYFVVKGNGIVEKVDIEYILVNLENHKKIKIATDFIFGNAVRDGSGTININDFVNMTEFNKVSVAINKLVKEKVVSRLKNSVRVGEILDFAGALEVNEEDFDSSNIFLIPLSVKISNGKTD